MAIQTRIINDLYTEIYVDRGGDFITQSAPTNFHQFYTRKILTESESIDDFREVTASQKAKLEQDDAKWVAPSEELVDQAIAAGFTYNETNGFFALNGLEDLTSKDTRIILEAGRPVIGATAHYCNIDYLRTNLPARDNTVSGEKAFSVCHHIEVANCYGMIAGLMMFSGNNSLKRIINMYSLNADKISQGCFNTYAVEFIGGAIRGKYPTIDLKLCSKIGADSFQTWLDNAFNTVPINIILHPSAYARVTEEQFALAATKDITFSTT